MRVSVLVTLPIVLASTCILSDADTRVGAATLPQCDQQYAAKKALSQAGGQSRTAFVKASLTVADPSPTAEAAEDPVADLISVQFQNNMNYRPHFGRSGGFAQV
jgi:hypothetical protein